MASEDTNIRWVLSPILILARFCCLFPVTGVTPASNSLIRFRWCSILTSYTLIFWGFSCVSSVTSLYYSITYDNGEVTAASYIMLLTMVGPPFLITPVFLHVARQWSTLVTAWEAAERFLPEVDPRGGSLARRVKRLFTVVVCLRLCHSLVHKAVQVTRTQQCLKTASLFESLHIVFTMRYPLMFFHSPFPSVRGILLSALYKTVVDFQLVVGPLLVAAVSKCLSVRLEALNLALERHRGRAVPTVLWRTWRERYNLISRLAHLTDDILNPLIFVSCFIEATLIILTIYFVTKSGTPIHIFVVVSLLVFHGYVIISMMMSAAEVLERSKQPLSVLQSVPAVNRLDSPDDIPWRSTEVGRFHDQVVHDRLALSGGKFFHISRSFMVKVFTTMLTYEIVLIQANVVRREVIEAYIDREVNTTVYSVCTDTVRPLYQLLRNFDGSSSL